MTFPEKSYTRFSPIDKTPTWDGRWASSLELDTSYERAREAQSNWADRTSNERMDVCRRFAEALHHFQDEIAKSITLETGKPVWESRSEVQSAIAKVSNAIEAIQKRRWDSSDGATSIRYRAIGTVLVLGPYNLPLHLPGAHIVPSLLAGNTVVFKPSEKTPSVGDWISRCWLWAGLPPGVLELVHGSREVAQWIVQKEDLAGVFFTGSFGAGVELHRALAGRPDCLLALEMGGNNPMVIDVAPERRAAIETIIQSSYLTSGQRCTCARRLIVLDIPENRDLVDKLSFAIRRIRYGNPFHSPEPYMGPLVSEDAASQIQRAQEIYRELGGQPLVESKRDAINPCMVSPGLWEVPSSFVHDEEYFGPLATVCYVESFEHAIEVANRSRYGLAAGILTDRREHFDRFVASVRAGIVNWNSPTTGASGKLPFGGIGASGNHRPSGFFAADYCSDPIASVESSRLTPSSNLPPGLEELGV